MKIPKTIMKDNRKYIFEKIYPNFIMYKNEYGIKVCFSLHELGLVKEIIKPPKMDKNVEKVKL